MDDGVVTNVGLEYLAKNANGVADTEFLYMALGTGSTAASATDTALGSENTLYGSARKQATCTYSATGIATWEALFSFTGNVTVREIGIFDASNRLLYRRVLADNKPYSDAMAARFTVSMTFQRA
jgi:hypothetical protein